MAMVAAGFSPTEADQLRRSMATFKFTAACTSFRTSSSRACSITATPANLPNVVANPMWNQPVVPEVLANDPFDRFRTTGGVTTGKGDWAWLQHTLACLNDHGRAAVVLDTGAASRGSGSKNEDKERNIRKWFVDRDLIDGVILLPDNLFL
jgi:type I restriction-modification system DNA methylase subunit